MACTPLESSGLALGDPRSSGFARRCQAATRPQTCKYKSARRRQSCDKTSNLQIQKRTSWPTLQSERRRFSSSSAAKVGSILQRARVVVAFRRRLRKSQKAHVVRGVRKRKTNPDHWKGIGPLKIPDTTHFHLECGSESRKFFSKIESSLYVISVRNVLLDHLPSSCVSTEGDLSGSRTPAPPTHSD